MLKEFGLQHRRIQSGITESKIKGDYPLPSVSIDGDILFLHNLYIPKSTFQTKM